MMTPIRPLGHRRVGAVLVETAMVMPVVLVIVWGSVEIVRAMRVGQLATHAARYGARAAILVGSSNAVVVSDVQKYVAGMVKGLNPEQVSVDIQITPGAGNRNPGHQLSAAMPRDLCKVTVLVPCERVSPFPSRFLTGSNLRGACAMPHE